jgi:RNA polymerase sigma-70 factor (ECF subfamily)
MMRFADRSTAESVARVRDRNDMSQTDPDAIVRLEAQHGQAMFGFVRRLGLSDPQAQDCVQEGLLRLLAELQRGTAILDPKAWVYRAIYRIAMDEHRLRRRVDGLISMLGGRTTPEPHRHDQTDRIAVWFEVDRLPTRQRQVLYLRYRADLPYDEIGTILGMTASAARSHATQAMHTLRARLDDSGLPAGERR